MDDPGVSARCYERRDSMGVELVPDTEETRKAMNLLAEHQMIKKLEEDILLDMTIRKREGWDVWEYVDLIQDMLDKIKGARE